MNLILLTIDAWRPDFVGDHAGVRLTPALDRVAGRLARFDRVWANGPWTTPALISVFTGEPSRTHGVHFEWSRPRRGPALASNLRAAGYQVPNLCYLNRLDNYLNLGFEPSGAPAPPGGPPGAGAEPDRLAEAIRTTPEPFFLWYHYKFVHLPYWPAERFRRALGVVDVPPHIRDSVGTGFVVPRDRFTFDARADADQVRRLYAAGVLEMNEWLEGILEVLEATGRGARTCLVLTSDHGEELLEHGHVGHASTAHHATLFEEVLRIPLLVVDPRVEGPRRIEARVQGLDLFPTLHGLAGVPCSDAPGIDWSPSVLSAGRIPEASEPRVFTFQSARKGCPTPRELAHHQVVGASDGRHKLIVQRYDQEQSWLFDLQSDPGERAPLSPAERPEIAGALQRALGLVTGGSDQASD